MIALRADLCESIPEESAVDEASLEAIAVKRGLKLKYIPDATFVNRGPDTFRDFISQRRRIACGHRWLSKTRGYKVATGSSWAVFRMLFNQPHLRPMDWMRTAGVIGLEAVCRFLGLLDYYSRPQTHRVWRIAASTKQSFESEELAGMLNHKETSQV
jgi:cellulose synthase/poly-beta-1,6-N-acetylglucosamine synthase-like glycosyltransferase